ncbi:MAG: sigma factor [Pirellulales bacterium]
MESARTALHAPDDSHLVNRISLDRDHNDDLVQDILLVLVEKISEFVRQRPGSFRAWLRTIATNKALDFVRRQQKGKTVPMSEFEAQVESDEQWISEDEYRKTLAQNALRLMSVKFSDVAERLNLLDSIGLN